MSLGKDRSILNEDSEMTPAKKITSDNKLLNLTDSLHCRGLAGWQRNHWTFNLLSQIVDRSESQEQGNQQFALPLMSVITPNWGEIEHVTVDLSQEEVLETVWEKAQEKDIRFSEELPQTLDLEQPIVWDELPVVESMSEEERYHQDYFAEKIAVQHAVKQQLQAIMPEQDVEMTASRLAEIELIEDELIEEDLIKSELVETVVSSVIEVDLSEIAVVPDTDDDAWLSIETQSLELESVQQQPIEEFEQLVQPNSFGQLEPLDQIEQHEHQPVESPQVEIQPLLEQHSRLDRQKIIDTYQQIIEMYK